MREYPENIVSRSEGDLCLVINGQEIVIPRAIYPKDAAIREYDDAFMENAHPEPTWGVDQGDERD